MAVEQVMHKIIFAIKAEKGQQEVFDILADNNIDFGLMKSAQTLVNLVTNLNNNTRKWANCGFRPVEMKS